MISRKMEKFGGVIIASLGGGLTAWNWHLALHKGYFLMKVGVVGPFFLVMGIALILFPGYRTERIERGEDITKLQGLALLTPRWWGVLIVGLGLGMCNWFLLSR
jgi:hypothetical protein